MPLPSIETSLQPTPNTDQSVRLEETTARIIAVLEAIPDAIITTNHTGHIELYNVSAEPLFYYGAEEVIGKHISVLLPGLNAHLSQSHLDKKAMVALRKDGSSFPIELKIGEINLGGKGVQVCVVRDISARIHAEQEAAAARDQLIQAEKLASLGELVAGVAHEINTPVGIGVTAVSHLREHFDAVLKEYQSGALQRPTLIKFLDTCDQATRILSTNLRRASELIHSFKQVAVDRASSDLRRILLREYLDDLLLSLQPQLKKTRLQISIECDANLSITTYPGAIAQILTNFVMNSIIHGYEKDAAGQLHINVTELGNDIELRYSDDGKGVSEQYLAKIFDPFFTTRRGAGSSGLGLHIVYNLANTTLEGKIYCASAVNQGTVFTIRFPKHLEAHHE